MIQGTFALFNNSIFVMVDLGGDFTKGDGTGGKDDSVELTSLQSNRQKYLW